MTTIPGSDLVNVVPSVLSAGGNSLDIIGLMITNGTRVPIGQVLPFASAAAVQSYFGGGTTEASLALNYFGGFTGATKVPASLLFAQYNQSAVAAYLRGGDISALPLANLQAVNGTLIVTIDGKVQTGDVNLASASSPSSAAAIIQTALDVTTNFTATIDPNAVTASIDPNVVTGSITGTTMTVSGITSGAVAPGETVSGLGVTPGTTVVAQITGGTTGGTGTYQVSVSQTVLSTVLTLSGGTLTVTAVTTGTIAAGQTLTGTSVAAGQTVVSALTGTGGDGKYAVSISQTVVSEAIVASGGTLDVTALTTGSLGINDVVAGIGVTPGNRITGFLTGTGTTGTYLVSVGDSVGSEAMTVAGAAATVAYDSTSGGFVVTSGTTGASSTLSFATGTTATALKLTAAAGAVLSQGAAASAPSAFMTSLTQVTQNWAAFMTTFDPDASGNTVKQAFAAWTSQQNNRYGYVCWDTDATPTNQVPASASLGAILAANGDSGTCLIDGDVLAGWGATLGAQMAAFVMGAAAAIDFEAKAGRITFAYKWQAGLIPGVTTETVAADLIANGYNFGGAYASANTGFTFFQTGVCTGPFKWFDSFVNQIWLNSRFQLALLTFLSNIKSVPYNDAGNTLIEQALADPIEAGLNFGAFAPGAISAAQIAEVNAAAGAQVSNTLQAQGYYLQILPASSATRAARGSPPCTFFYLDRGSVQKINLSSVAVQ